MAPLFVLGLLALDLWKFFGPSGKNTTTMFPPPPPPPPPPTRCEDLPGWTADESPTSPSMGLALCGGNAIALLVFWLFFLGFFSLGVFHLLSRADSLVRRLGFSGSWPLGALFASGGLVADLLAPPHPHAPSHRGRTALVVQRYHARLRELKARRERKIAFSLHWIKALSRKQLAGLRKERPQMREALMFAANTVEWMESYNALYQSTADKLASEIEQGEFAQKTIEAWKEYQKTTKADEDAAWEEVVSLDNKVEALEEAVTELKSSATEAESAREKAEKDKLAMQSDLQRASEKLVNSERRQLELEALLTAAKESNIGLQADYRKLLQDNDRLESQRITAVRRAGKAEKRTSEVEAELEALRAPAEPTPTTSEPEARPVGPETPPVQAKTSPEGEVGTPADLETLPTTVEAGPSEEVRQCWATNTKPCHGDVSKGLPCIGNPDKYDAQHNLLYDWTAPDLYYGPYKASSHDREKKQGSLARKRGLCVDCFNARSEVRPAATPYGAREPVEYLF